LRLRTNPFSWRNQRCRAESAKEFAAADPDHDGTLTLEEYLAVVEQRFNAANPDKDGTLDAKELRSPAGRIGHKNADAPRLVGLLRGSRNGPRCRATQ
jgi:hypothetical protein